MFAFYEDNLRKVFHDLSSSHYDVHEKFDCCDSLRNGGQIAAVTARYAKE
jgi:hypothetical protein